ncbi:MAG: hypothetical protein HY676_01415 [Chloroflexi bacterium]|nr:hypothetical protein [Chloroflexota bacterium]
MTDKKLANKVLAEWREALGNAEPFPDTEYPYPVNQVLAGSQDLARLKENHIEHNALLLAEAVAACQPEAARFFIPDREVRALLLRLNTATGWALLWGNDDPETAQLASLIQKERFVLFLALPPGSDPALIQGGRDLGNHPTAPIYFLQALARYALIYGRVSPGDDHAFADFLQDHSPGVIFITRSRLSPAEEAMLRDMADLGIPIVLGPNTSVELGLPRAESPQAMVDMALKLPALRVRRQLRYSLDIPFSFDVAYAGEKIEEGPAIGGTPLSFLSLRPEDRGDGIEVVSRMGADVGIEVFVGDPRVDITATDYLEDVAGQLPGYIQGVTCEVKEGCPTIRWRPDMALLPEHLAKAIYHGLKAEFPMQNLKVRLVFDRERLPSLKEAAQTFRDLRQKAVASATEETEPYFYGCFRCHSFALEHACTITPERPPQCDSRTWMHVKARALLSEYTSAGAGGIRLTPSRDAIIEKGRPLDSQRGEWEGANLAAQKHTQGKMRRVFLHSLFGHPHSACSCFQALAFHIPHVDGIGVMARGFKGQTPDGRSWDALANAVAGKQQSGYLPMGRAYLRSAKFLQGDGGWRRVVWMPQELKKAFAADKSWIATEVEAPTLEKLQDFLGHHRWTPSEEDSARAKSHR